MIFNLSIFNFLKDFFLSKEVIYIQEQSYFNLFLEDIETKKSLAIDTEFIWRDTYIPKLSLIQISTENKIYILDCLVLNISKLEKVFMDDKVLKIFHSIRGDSSVIYNCLGIKMKNIFDTQLAEDILNRKNGNQISYKKLVKKYFFRDISKSETNSNWEKRPLSNNQLDYAAEDVRYLHSIMKIQNKKLIKLNKLDLFEILCKEEQKLGEEDFSVSRLRRFKKKNRNLSEVEIKIFDWRENQAKILNIPPSHIIEDKNFKRLKKIIDQKKINELNWIIKKNSSRSDFLNSFV